jgi:outer membrane assembly lipoprotein YfiO
MDRSLMRGALVPLALAGMALGGCAGKSVPVDAAPDDVLAAAEKKLGGEDWYDAAELLEFFLRNHPGSALAPRAKLLLGDARFGLEEYVVARGHYEDVVQDFPASVYVEEARWKIARCSYEMARPYDRDQTETEQALKLLEEFRTDYPASRFLPEVVAAIADCRDRLARREFEAGRFYAKQHRPRSAKIQFEYVLASFPETSWARKACFEIGELYRIRGKSAEAAQYFRRVLQDWPDSEESGRAAQSLSQLGFAQADTAGAGS